MYPGRSWREKLDNPNLPKVVEIPPVMRKKFGTGTMLIPKPLEVETLIRTVKKGQLVTIAQMRSFLAAKYAADVTCPLVTGIGVWLSAEAAEEDARAGKSRVTPYWRVVTNDGALNPKFPGGVKAQAEKLRAEGHAIDARRKVPRVIGFERHLTALGVTSAACA